MSLGNPDLHFLSLSKLSLINTKSKSKLFYINKARKISNKYYK